MTSPGPECTTGAFEKHRMWLKGPGQARALAGSRKAAPGSSGKVTRSGLFAIRGHAAIMANYKIIVLF
jgi:hypothetical protein